MTYFSHRISSGLIEDIKKEHGQNVGGIEKLTAEPFFITQQTLGFLTPDYLYNKCKEDPGMSIEAVGRTTWLAVQSINKKYPERNYREIIKNRLK